MQLLGNQRPAPFALLTQGQRNNRHVNIPRLRILKRLANVVAVDEFRLDRLPNTRALQRLLCRQSVRRVIGVRNRNPLDLRPREVRHSFDLQRTVSRRPERDPTARVNLFSVGNDQPLLSELVDITDVRGGEDVHRRAVFDLARQQSGRAKHEHDLHLVSRFKLAAEFVESVGQVRCGSVRDLVCLIVCALAGPPESERCQQRDGGEESDNVSLQVGKSLGV